MKKTVFLLTMMTMMVSGAKAQRIFYEDFSNNSPATTLPAGWTVYGDTLHNHVVYSQYNQSWQVWYPNGVEKDGEAMSVTLIADGTWDPCDRWLITPRIALPADSVMSLLFRHHCVVFSQFHVLLSTTGTNKEDFTDTIDFVTLQPQWQTQHISLESYAGDSVYIAFVNDVIHGNGHCSQYMVIDDVEVKYIPENDIMLENVTLPQQACVGQPVTATLHVVNTGRNHVSSFSYTYQIGNNAPVENTISVNLWPYWTKDVNVTFVPSELGEGTIEFQVGRPNGVGDYDSADNFIAQSITVTEGSLGISDMDNSSRVTAYPNPSTGKVTVQLDDGMEGVSRAWLTDVMGRREEVRLTSEGGERYGLDLTNHQDGTYILTVIAPSGQMNILRLIKQS